MKGQDVAMLQERLSRLGYYPWKPDGVFGLLTMEALRAFQKAHRLRVDAIAGKEVFAVLESGQALPEVSHVVSRSDTLSSIARTHGVPVELILRANGLDGAHVREGQCLVIPVSRVIGYCAGPEDPDASYESFERHLGLVSAVAPRWFHLDADGSVSGEPARRLVALASLGGVAVHPVVSDGAGPDGSAVLPEILMDGAARRRAVKALIAVASESRAHGLVLSVRRLPRADSYALTSFVRELTRALHEAGGRSLAIDLPIPAPADEGAPPEAPAEYREIAQVASQVILRAYTEPGDQAAPGPAASPAATRAALKAFVRAVMPWKLVLAVPAFGVDFSCAPGAPPARRSHREVAEILDIFRPSVARTEPGGSCTFRYRSFRVNHTVYFEDAASIGTHADLALRFRLAGIALADLGEEDPMAWDAIRTRFKVLRREAAS